MWRSSIPVASSGKSNRCYFIHILDRWIGATSIYSMSNQKIFLITGISSGFGRAFARAALSAGHMVVGTVREESARRNFELESPGLAKAVVLDITDFDAIEPKV